MESLRQTVKTGNLKGNFTGDNAKNVELISCSILYMFTEVMLE